MKYDKSLIKNIHATSDAIPKQIYKDREMTVDDLKVINQKYFGGGMSQNHMAPPWFELYFDMHKFEYMAEFGSQKGCLSTYFANFAGVTEQMFFDTFEIYPNVDWFSRANEGCGHWFEKLASISPYINYHYKDVFTDEVKNHVKENIDQFKTFIFADGGDKTREFNEYAPFLKVGDCIAVHDWPSEVNESGIGSVMQEYGFERDEPFATSATNLNTAIMPFIKVR